MRWLDAATNLYPRRPVALAVSANPDVEAVILFGSAARHELRPMSDPEPSDVDVLFLMMSPPDSDANPHAAHSKRITREQHLAISRAEVEAYPVTADTSMRQVQTILADPSFEGWDPSFMEAITRDGLLLWARHALPALLAPVAQRSLSSHT